jgi:hypothetical protein
MPLIYINYFTVMNNRDKSDHIIFLTDRTLYFICFILLQELPIFMLLHLLLLILVEADFNIAEFYF